jgi:hypothetical protein
MRSISLVIQFVWFVQSLLNALNLDESCGKPRGSELAHFSARAPDARGCHNKRRIWVGNCEREVTPIPPAISAAMAGFDRPVTVNGGHLAANCGRAVGEPRMDLLFAGGSARLRARLT